MIMISWERLEDMKGSDNTSGYWKYFLGRASSLLSEYPVLEKVGKLYNKYSFV